MNKARSIKTEAYGKSSFLSLIPCNDGARFYDVLLVEEIDSLLHPNK